LFFVLCSLFPLKLPLHRFAARHALWQPSTRIVAAVSGGSDSVALLRLLHDEHHRGGLTLDAVAHLHHGIRGEDADGDDEFCRALAAALDVPYVSARVDVPASARERGTSIEVAARDARHRFLEEVRRARRADRIATAHTADDQAETVVLRLVRGAGLHGLAAIAPQRGALIRPLLEMTRAELREYLRTLGQAWREDATNRDVSQPRNRIRHELLPFLEAHFNPRVREALARFADHARLDDDLLNREAAAAAVTAFGRDADSVRIDPRAVAALPEAIARRVLRSAIAGIAATDPGFAEVERLADVVAGRTAATELCGLRVEHSGRFVVLVSSSAPALPMVPFRLDLSIPGSLVWAAGGWALDAEGPIPRGTGSAAHSPDQVEIDAAGLGPSVVVRQREPGDRIRPLGMTGRKKLQDVLVDRKVPAERRDLVPIVTDRTGRLIWVAGHVLADEFRVSSDTNAVVILKLRRI
jgi:tRNA(Ile)-lysidine synthase